MGNGIKEKTKDVRERKGGGDKKESGRVAGKGYDGALGTP